MPHNIPAGLSCTCIPKPAAKCTFLGHPTRPQNAHLQKGVSANLKVHRKQLNQFAHRHTLPNLSPKQRFFYTNRQIVP